MTTIIYLRQEKVHVRSSAILYILKDLGRFWQLLFVFIIIPKFIRDAIYKIISRNRYKWFGKKEKCLIPSPELKKKFLE